MTENDILLTDRESAKLIVERCDHLPDVFTHRDIHQRSWTSLKDNQAVKQALELLCCCNYIREISEDNTPKSGRPTRRYEWHPFVKSHKRHLNKAFRNLMKN
ncbi:hypothetical protein [Bartonella rattimassiliensis]|uniref:Uncharacterized protein n=1 Tax=Bartonella rattimassiliensis 15908 TaxID=1094556 RepID=J1JJN0_9HYPH|nr:hypothetical protein [Bartonella rattimassiliensis]EJF84847.1 hypothetical protein MCY_01445 [Bartonella rattimassiliensis 15908]